MNHVASWALPISWWVPPAPLWAWPVAVCLAAWLFRRWALGRTDAGFRFRLPGTLPLVSSILTRRGGGERPPRGASPRAENPGERERASHWWNLFGSRKTDLQRITVGARKTLGPQLQFLILCAGNREYHVLSQAGAAPLVLSTRILPPPRTPTAEAGTDCAGTGIHRVRLSRYRRVSAFSSQRPRKYPPLGKSDTHVPTMTLNGVSK